MYEDEEDGVPRNERFKQDMEQAMAMRGADHDARQSSPACRMQRADSSKSVLSTVSTRSTVPEKDVSLALSGLDRAEELKRKGNLEEALRLYQLSIEALIKLMNSNRPLPRTVDRETLAERTRAALTDAEDVKRALHNKAATVEVSSGGPIKPAAATANKPQPQSTAAGYGIAHFLFGRGQPSRTTIPPPQTTPLARSSSPRRPPVSATNGATDANWQPKVPIRRSGPSIRTVKSDDTHPTKRTHVKNNTNNASQQHQRRPNRSSLDYKNDPFVKAIKDDLFVDSKTITTRWDDIAGLTSAKRSLQEAAILPLLRPDLYTGLRAPPRGILLYGPPGTGKTMLVRAVAHESQCILFACSASAMTSKWVGEGEKIVRTLFRLAADVAPSIIFFDEIDALLSSRKEGDHEASRRFKTEWMIQVEGIAAGGGRESAVKCSNDSNYVDHRVLVIGCTNCPWDIDDAVMRRFQRRVYVPLPDKDARRALLEGILSKAQTDHNLTQRQVTQLVTMTEGCSCSDISSIANEAAFGPLRDLGDMDAIRDVRCQDVRPIQFSDFRDAIQSSSKSVSVALLKKYAEWENEQAANRT